MDRDDSVPGYYISITIEATYHRYKKSFSLNNQLHKHLRTNKYTKSTIIEITIPKTELQFPNNDNQNLPIV